MENFRYSIVIRTLGKAGAVYQMELDSIDRQTVQPERIIVYLAEGYDRPKETIGREQVVYVRKGMVAQRALDYREVDTPYMLMLDDDVFLPESAVEKMAEVLLSEDADCVAADTFQNHKMSFIGKMKAVVSNWTFPMFHSEWAIKVQRTGSFRYNITPPRKGYCPSQSAAGPCSLWKTDAFAGIRFSDEIWLDRLGFAYGEDLLCFYKLYLNGGRLLMHYVSGVKHLDARSSRMDYSNDPSRFRKRARAWFLLWWRIDFGLSGKPFSEKFLSLAEYVLKFIWMFFVSLIYGVIRLSYKPLWLFILGNIDGCKFVHTSEFRQLPDFRFRGK